MKLLAAWNSKHQCTVWTRESIDLVWMNFMWLDTVKNTTRLNLSSPDPSLTNSMPAHEERKWRRWPTERNEETGEQEKTGFTPPPSILSPLLSPYPETKRAQLSQFELGSYVYVCVGVLVCVGKNVYPNHRVCIQ